MTFVQRFDSIIESLARLYNKNPEEVKEWAIVKDKRVWLESIDIKNEVSNDDRRKEAIP